MTSIPEESSIRPAPESSYGTIDQLPQRLTYIIIKLQILFTSLKLPIVLVRIPLNIQTIS